MKSPTPFPASMTLTTASGSTLTSSLSSPATTWTRSTCYSTCPVTACSLCLPAAHSHTLAAELREEIAHYRTQVFAESTKATYKTHRDTFLRFCLLMGFDPVPLQPGHLLQYVAFLARTLKVPTIKSYLNIVGLLHKEFGLPNPLLDNWPLKALLTGIKRVKGQPPNQKLPITVPLLRRIHSKLKPHSSFDASSWATCLVAFFGLFRKSHLLPTSAKHFNPSKQFTKADFQFHPWGILITMRWSKTIQFRERVVCIPLLQIPGSSLCPVQAVTQAFRFTVQADSNSQAFTWLDQSSLKLRVLTYRAFISKLRETLQSAGIQAAAYAGHSFRRGGASFAYQSGVPLELIKVLGDWRSNAVLLYLTIPLNISRE